MDDPVIARADGSALYNFAVAVDDLDAADHPRGARRGPPLQHAQAAARVRGAGGAAARATPTCRCCTGPTARSSPSATAPPRCRSCATPATCPRRSTTTSRCSAPASPPTRSTSRSQELAERFRLERVSKNPAVFDERKLRHMNGRWLRELSTEELTRRLEQFTGRTRPARRGRDRGREDPDAGRLLAAGRLPVRRPGRRPEGVREGDLRATAGADALRAAREALAAAEPFTVEAVEAALRGGRGAGRASPARCSSRSGWRSPARPSRRGSSRASRCSAGTRRWRRIDRALQAGVAR